MRKVRVSLRADQEAGSGPVSSVLEDRSIFRMTLCTVQQESRARCVEDRKCTRAPVNGGLHYTIQYGMCLRAPTKKKENNTVCVRGMCVCMCGWLDVMHGSLRAADVTVSQHQAQQSELYSTYISRSETHANALHELGAPPVKLLRFSRSSVRATRSVMFAGREPARVRACMCAGVCWHRHVCQGGRVHIHTLCLDMPSRGPHNMQRH